MNRLASTLLIQLMFVAALISAGAATAQEKKAAVFNSGGQLGELAFKKGTPLIVTAIYADGTNEVFLCGEQLTCYETVMKPNEKEQGLVEGWDGAAWIVIKQNPTCAHWKDTAGYMHWNCVP